LVGSTLELVLYLEIHAETLQDQENIIRVPLSRIQDMQREKIRMIRKDKSEQSQADLKKTLQNAFRELFPEFHTEFLFGYFSERFLLSLCNALLIL
jgi:hypothetical protein